MIVPIQVLCWRRREARTLTALPRWFPTSVPLAPTRSAHRTLAWRAQNLSTALARVELVFTTDDDTAVGHGPEFKSTVKRDFRDAVGSTNTRAAERVVARARSEAPCSECADWREANRSRVRREQPKPQVATIDAGRAYVDLALAFDAECIDDPAVCSLPDFLALIKAKRAKQTAPRNVLIVVAYLDALESDATRQGVADALGLNERTLRNWTDWARRFSSRA